MPGAGEPRRAEDLAAPDRQIDRFKPFGGEARDFEADRIGQGGGKILRGWGVDRVADHRPDQGLGTHPLGRGILHFPAVAEHDDAVGDRENLVKVMRDVEDGDPLIAERPEDLQQPAPLGAIERGRRLVEDQDFRIAGQRLGDFDELALAGREPPDLDSDGDREAEPIEMVPGPRAASSGD